jgi:diaminohydroxyphosphoribosylaminopyrimidine deaminase/5-amino-6-(5-phosphoribosylamino)uracil reductase
MAGNEDIKFMRRCIDLASAAEGLTYPNPLVGSVIVHDGIIIGEGYHLKAGEAHAEVNAINSVRDRGLLKNSTLYVNLEPCSHFGKTPPCADLIISEDIRKIVIGTVDTSKKVSGRGIQKLKDAGCEVVTGVLEEDCRRLNIRFFTFNEKRRPYIILKWAQSADGFIDIDRGKDQPSGPYWITGSAEKNLVHRWRAAEQSILAGASTVRTDNPLLNVREWTGSDPLRLILSSSGKLGEDPALFKTKGMSTVFTCNREACFKNAETVILEAGTAASDQITKYLYDAGIQSMMIEGGAATINHFISEGLWDEARIFYGKEYFKRGVHAPDINGVLSDRIIFSGSRLEVLFNGMNSH